jgi:chromatin structure-remodeling complex subunit RSC1/2
LHEELQKLVTKGEITPDEAELPDLGELPPAEDSPPPDRDDEDMDEELEEEDDEEEDDDDSDDNGHRRRSRRRGRPSISRRDRDDGARDEESYKKRGRPPKVLTPMEARIYAVIKGLRKFKNDDGELRIVPFEKLPDKVQNPEYYHVVANPLALDNIKKKAKRKKYQNVDHVMRDIELMFENAKRFNDENSEIFRNAVDLQRQARIMAEQEKAKPDESFRDDDGKLPLANIQYNGQLWKVGK